MKYVICGYAENGIIYGKTLGKQGNRSIEFEAEVIKINGGKVEK